MLLRSTRISFRQKLIPSGLNLTKNASKVSVNLLWKVNMSSSLCLRNNAIDKQLALPWYLRESQSSELDKPIFKAEFPELPQDAPESLEPVIRNMIDKLGLDNFKVFDLRGREEELPISSMADIMVICQGKSEKHLQNASQELLTFIKKEFGSFPYVEGLIKPNSTIRMRRRMKRRMSSNTRKQKQDDDFGVGVNSWIMIDSKVDNVFIHLLTPERRKIVNLEYMWCKPEEKDIYKQEDETVLENGREAYGNDSVFAGIFKRFYSTGKEIPLDQLALQQLQFNDLKSFEETSHRIRNDSDIAEKTLSHFVEDLKLQDINQITPEYLSQYSDFFHRSFPLLPTRMNWLQLFEFESILHLLSPTTVSFTVIRDTLKNQIAAGEPISLEQFSQYLDLLSQSPELNTYKQGRTELNATVYSKFSFLFEILRIIEVNLPTILKHEEIVLKLLKIPTLQHLYPEITPDQQLLLHKNFENLLETLYADSVPSAAIIEFVLTTYAKANNVDSFYSFWDSIHKLRQDGDELVIDERPWNLLFDVLIQDYRENFVEKLVNNQLPKFVTLHPSPSSETKAKVSTLLDRFDESGVAYKELRDHFI